MIQINQDIDTSDVKVETLGPSTFTFLNEGCKYQHLLNHTKNVSRGATLPSAKKAITGTVVHSLFERRTKGEIPDEATFEIIWEEELRKQEEDIKRTYGLKDWSISDYDKMYSAMETAMKMPQYGKSNKQSDNGVANGTYVIVEKLYKTSTLCGKIDKIEKNDSKVIIADFKSGDVMGDDGKIKKAYVVQLNLYAHMYHSQEGEKATELQIIDIDGNIHQVPIWDDIELQKNLALVQDVIDELNSGKGIQLASPSDKCANCNERMKCTPYWNSPHIVVHDPNDPNKRYEDLEFTVKSIIDKTHKDVVEFYGGRIKGLNRYTFELEEGHTYRARGLNYIDDQYEFGTLYSTSESTIIMELL